MTPATLRRLRKQLGLTQPQLAARLGLKSGTQVSHLESGRTKIAGAKLAMLKQLAEGQK